MRGPVTLEADRRKVKNSSDWTISLPSLFTPRAHSSTCAAAWHDNEITISLTRDMRLSFASLLSTAHKGPSPTVPFVVPVRASLL